MTSLVYIIQLHSLVIVLTWYMKFLWLYFRIKFALRNSRNIMEVWSSYCKVISPKFEIFQHKSSVHYCIMCSVLKWFLFQTCPVFLSFKSAIFIRYIDSLEMYSESVASIKNSARLFPLNVLPTFFNANKLNYFGIN